LRCSQSTSRQQWIRPPSRSSMTLSPFMAKLQGVWATGKTLEDCPRVLARSHRGLDCLEAEIWPSNTRHRRAFDQCISGDGIHCRISFCRSQEESSSGGWANWDSWVLFLVLVTSNVKGPFRGTHSESSWKRYQYCSPTKDTEESWNKQRGMV